MENREPFPRAELQSCIDTGNVLVWPKADGLVWVQVQQKLTLARNSQGASLGAPSLRHRFIVTPSAKTNKGGRLLEIGAPKGAPYGAKRIAIVNSIYIITNHSTVPVETQTIQGGFD